MQMFSANTAVIIAGLTDYDDHNNFSPDPYMQIRLG